MKASISVTNLPILKISLYDFEHYLLRKLYIQLFQSCKDWFISFPRFAPGVIHIMLFQII